MAAADTTKHLQGITPNQPADHAVAVTPSDSVDLTNTTRFLILGTGGAVKVTMADGTTPTLTLPAGKNDLRVTRVWATGLGAANITACW